MSTPSVGDGRMQPIGSRTGLSLGGGGGGGGSGGLRQRRSTARCREPRHGPGDRSRRSGNRPHPPTIAVPVRGVAFGHDVPAERAPRQEVSTGCIRRLRLRFRDCEWQRRCRLRARFGRRSRRCNLSGSRMCRLFCNSGRSWHLLESRSRRRRRCPSRSHRRSRSERCNLSGSRSQRRRCCDRRRGSSLLRPESAPLVEDLCQRRERGLHANQARLEVVRGSPVASLAGIVVRRHRLVAVVPRVPDLFHVGPRTVRWREDLLNSPTGRGRRSRSSAGIGHWCARTPTSQLQVLVRQTVDSGRLCLTQPCSCQWSGGYPASE